MEPEFTQFAEIHLFPLLEGIEQVLDGGDQYRHHVRTADGGLLGYPATQLLERQLSIDLCRGVRFRRLVFLQRVGPKGHTVI